MTKSKRGLKIGLCFLLGAVLLGLLLWVAIGRNFSWGFARTVSHQEEALRLQVVSTAEKWLGCRESDGSHQAIIDLYNSHTPLARGYTVTYKDSWSAQSQNAGMPLLRNKVLKRKYSEHSMNIS